MKYRNLSKLNRNHPARNTTLRTIGAEYQSPQSGHWHGCKTTLSGKRTFNELEDYHSAGPNWRVPALP